MANQTSYSKRRVLGSRIPLRQIYQHSICNSANNDCEEQCLVSAELQSALPSQLPSHATQTHTLLSSRNHPI